MGSQIDYQFCGGWSFFFFPFFRWELWGVGGGVVLEWKGEVAEAGVRWK